VALIWYPTLVDKATALGFAVIQGHPFVGSRCRPHGTQPTDGLVTPSPQVRRVIRDGGFRSRTWYRGPCRDIGLKRKE
jgi:hypothetical protein